MSAYANAKALGRDAVLEKIKAMNLYEAGVYREKMTDHIQKAQEAAAEEGVDMCAVAALNNADTDMVFLELVRQAPDKILAGAAIAAIASGAGKAVLESGVNAAPEGKAEETVSAAEEAPAEEENRPESPVRDEEPAEEKEPDPAGEDQTASEPGEA